MAGPCDTFRKQQPAGIPLNAPAGGGGPGRFRIPQPLDATLLVPPRCLSTAAQPASISWHFPPTRISRDPVQLHPTIRKAITEILGELNSERIPFALFEGFRTPARQDYLFAQGRTRAGKVITRARAWQSYHNYGLAADFALLINKQWSWDDTQGKAEWWEKLHELGKHRGLESLSFERPHLQLSGLYVKTLRAGFYPDGGDMSWWHNLDEYRLGVAE